MTNEVVTKIINGHEYKIRHLGALENYNLALKIGDILGISLPEIAQLFCSGDYSRIGVGTYKIINSLVENDKENKLLFQILSTVTRNDVAVTRTSFDNMFTGNMNEMFELLFESMKVHFNHFLPKGGVSGPLISLLEKVTQSMVSLTKNLK